VFFAHHSHADTSQKEKKNAKKNSTPSRTRPMMEQERKEKEEKRRRKKEGSRRPWVCENPPLGFARRISVGSRRPTVFFFFPSSDLESPLGLAGRISSSL
jgi:hypothetical protein